MKLVVRMKDRTTGTLLDQINGFSYICTNEEGKMTFEQSFIDNRSEVMVVKQEERFPGYCAKSSCIPTNIQIKHVIDPFYTIYGHSEASLSCKSEFCNSSTLTAGILTSEVTSKDSSVHRIYPCIDMKCNSVSTINGNGGKENLCTVDKCESLRTDISGGCFGANTMVCVLGEIDKLMAVKDIRKGTRVLTDKGATTVECVVKLKYTGVMHCIGQSVQLTSYHPVLCQDQCYFANELSFRTGMYSRFTLTNDYVYDFVLSNRGLLCCSYLISTESTGTKLLHAATFGHTCQREKFVHPYFGSEAVVEDLKTKCPLGYEAGYIVMENYSYVRCDRSHLVTSLASMNV